MLEFCKNLLTMPGPSAYAAVAGIMFTAGLLGSLTHCTGMCGPFVLAQMGARLDHVPMARLGAWRRLAGAALLPYHAGRIATYTLFGAVGGGLSAQIKTWAAFPYIAAGLMMLAALLFLGAALRRLPRIALPGLPAPAGLTRLVRALFADPVGPRGFALGVLLGFLPCGLVWGAASASAASGNAWTGAAGMAAFGLGTVPALFGVGLGGNLILRRWRGALGFVTPAVMISNAAILLILAGGLMT